jgi:glycerate 2-kinase
VTVSFDPSVLSPDPKRRKLILDVLTSAAAAVDPAGAVGRALIRTPEGLVVAGTELPRPAGRVIILAFGKAAPAMAAAALEALRGLDVAGAVVSPGPAGLPGLTNLVGSHPVPDAGSLRGGLHLLHLATAAGPDDLVLVLVSGGGSSLAEVPANGLTLADIQELGRLLLLSGAPISEINTVRRHLSRFKGGRLAAAASPARVVTLVISDVVGNPLEAIAGGPTAADPTFPADALAVLERWKIDAPPEILNHLRREAAARRAPLAQIASPVEGIFVVADAAAAAGGALRAASARGLQARVISTTVEGSARWAGHRLAADAVALTEGAMGIYAGETTVTVTGKGRGGRNQELALAAGIALAGHPGVLVVSFATDGVDGPTDAAGGIGDHGTVERGRAAGIDPRAALEDNDSETYLKATSDLLRCGPTGTNVGDLMITLRGDAPQIQTRR